MIEFTMHCHLFTIIPLHFSGKNRIFSFKNNTDNKENEDIDIPIFDLSTIANATNNFCIDNKLGEGGFGPVYKVINMISYNYLFISCHWIYYLLYITFQIMIVRVH